MKFHTPEIIVMTTGGTIEKIYQEAEGTLENKENKGEIIRQKILAKLRMPYTNLSVFSLMSKDSLLMDDQDREIIFENIKKNISKKCPIVILHGTDTMEISARYCFEQKLKLFAPVIFTGAMAPLGFEGSDALQNVTESLLAAKLLTPGFYISFHNQIFEVPRVRKNKDKKTFEEVN